MGKTWLIVSLKIQFRISLNFIEIEKSMKYPIYISD